VPITRDPDRVGDRELAIACRVVAEEHPIGPAAGTFVLEGQPGPVAHQKRLRFASTDL
jgi:hypothetical protein